MNDQVSALRASGAVPGIAVGVVFPDPADPTQLTKIVLPFGQANTATGAKVTVHTQFEIASETKLFTAALLAAAVSSPAPGSSGALALDDTIGPLLPRATKLPAKVAAITLRQLATHRSGLPDDPICPDGTPGHWPTPAHAAHANYTADDLIFALTSPRCNQGSAQPGQEFLYSDFGFGLLGLILARHENPTQPDYFGLITRQITGPLGMADTGPEPVDGTPTLAQPYSKPGVRAPLWCNTGAMAGGGGLISSIDDMTTFVAAQLGSGPPAVVRALRATQVRQPSSSLPRIGANMGLAWQITPMPIGTVLIKDGGSAGSTSITRIMPSARIGITVLTNSRNHAVGPWSETLLAAVIRAVAHQ